MRPQPRRLPSRHLLLPPSSGVRRAPTRWVSSLLARRLIPRLIQRPLWGWLVQAVVHRRCPHLHPYLAQESRLLPRSSAQPQCLRLPRLHLVVVVAVPQLQAGSHLAQALRPLTHQRQLQPLSEAEVADLGQLQALVQASVQVPAQHLVALRRHRFPAVAVSTPAPAPSPRNARFASSSASLVVGVNAKHLALSFPAPQGTGASPGSSNSRLLAFRALLWSWLPRGPDVQTGAVVWGWEAAPHELPLLRRLMN